MASIGSLPFIGGANSESFVLLQSKSYRRPRLPICVYQPRKRIEDGSSVYNSACGHSETMKMGCLKLLNWRNRGRLWGSTHLRAAGKDFSDQTDDAIRATIEKSKKVLALQRELIQQIAERRKLVSSIESTILNPEEESISYEHGHNPSLNLDFASISRNNAVENQNISTSSSNHIHSSKEVVSKSPSSGAHKGSVGENHFKKNLPLEEDPFNVH